MRIYITIYVIICVCVCLGDLPVRLPGSGNETHLPSQGPWVSQFGPWSSSGAPGCWTIGKR